MSHFPDNLRATPDREIPATYRRLEKWVDDYPVPRSVPGVRVRRGPYSTAYFAETGREAWPYPFRSSVAGVTARISPGVVNLETPRMGELNLTLDGLDEDGRETGSAPVLNVAAGDEAGPGENGSSFVCVRLASSLETNLPLVEDLPLEWLRIVHLREMPPGFHSGGMPEVVADGVSFGYWPILKLYWNADRTAVRRFFQVTQKNLQWRYAPKDTNSARGRHWFL